MELHLMPRRYVHDPIHHRELSRLLADAGVTARQLSRVSGSDERRVMRWLSGEQEDPPLWVASLLVALSVPAARDAVKAFVDARVRDTRDDGGDA